MPLLATHLSGKFSNSPAPTAASKSESLLEGTTLLAHLQSKAAWALQKDSQALWSRLGTPLPDTFTKPNGERYLSGTEWEYEDAYNAQSSPDILVYRRTERLKLDPDDLQFDEQREQYKRVKQFFNRFVNPDASLKAGFNTHATPTEFKEVFTKHLEELVQQLLSGRGRELDRSVENGAGRKAEPSWTGPPYPGLRAFTGEEAAIFFGRGRETDALIARLRDSDQRFLAVVGASGTGKSSLVRAGLLPRLADGAIKGSQHWCVLTFTPAEISDDPFQALATRLSEVLPPGTRRPAREIATALATVPRRITDYAAMILAGQPAAAALVLVIDQLEELFTVVTVAHRRAFIELVTHATGDSRLRVLSTLRADFLSQCTAESKLAALLQGAAGTFPLGRPGLAALTDMIRKPGERAGLDIEEDLVEGMLKDAGTDPGVLPLLAFCLDALYCLEAPQHRLTLAAYEDLRRLHGAIGRQANAFLKNLRTVEGCALDTALPRLFRALVYVDAAGMATRRRTFHDELGTDPPMPRLVEALVQGRLLVAENIGGRAIVTLAHDVLLAAWPDLCDWLNRNRAQMQSLQRWLLNLEAPDAVAADRRRATEALGEMGPAAAEAIPALIKVLSDAEPGVRSGAADALGKIGPAAAEAIPALIEVLSDAKPRVRSGAADALGEIGPAAVPALIEVLSDASWSVRSSAATALSKIGPAAAEAIPALIKVLSDADWNVRGSAATALGEIGPAAAEAIPALIKVLSDAEPGVRSGTADALGKIGPAAVPALIKGLSDADWNVRSSAATALRKIGPAAAEALPALIEVLSDASWSVRSSAATALGKIGPAAAEAIPALIRVLCDAEPGVRSGAANALGEIGPAAAEAVPALIKVLSDADRNVRSGAADALGKIGPAAAEAVPALLEVLSDAERNVRSSARTALRKIGPAAAQAEALTALEAARREEEGVGRLKIFVGAAPGVGTTYEMLQNARAKRMEGVDLVVGVVETHGRKETQALLDGLQVIPRKHIEYRGQLFDEMDIDAIIARRPQLALVDELAHTNAPESRHPKRYLDVEELLDRGIDVYTTVNIQHIESLNDVVAQITRVRVRETVPDQVFDLADAIELVDLTPDDLIQRLKEGKVYVPKQAERALEHFFSPANLTALRELALRRTAERVDQQLLTQMQARAISGPWAAGERVLVCISEDPRSGGLVRYAKRLADRLHAPFSALFIEGRRARQLNEEERDRVADALRLAEALGGEAVTIPSSDKLTSDDVLSYARTQNITQIVLGKSSRSRWYELLHGSVVHDLARAAGNISVHVIAGEHVEGLGEPIPKKTVMTVKTAKRIFDPRPYVIATLAVAAALGLGKLITPFIGVESVDLAFLTVAALFFFTVNVAARVRRQATAAMNRARMTELLYAFSRKLAGVGTLDDVLWAITYQTALMLKMRVAILLPEDQSIVVKASYPPEDTLADADIAAAKWAWEHNRPAGRGSDTLVGAKRLFLPMRTGRGAVGVIGIDSDKPGPLLTPDERRLLDALSDQGALAIERVQLVDDMVAAKRTTETDRLRSALLTSISHDLKTPLASVFGAAGTLRDFSHALSDTDKADLLATIIDESDRLNRFIANLLDMTRLESGAVVPNLALHDLGEIVGSALRRASNILVNHRVEISLAADLPMLNIDAVLFEQALFNLFDSAAKHAAAGTLIRILAWQDGTSIWLQIIDEGEGILPADLEHIFDKSFRAEKSDQVPAGTGLGLAIARGFIEAMHGTITVANRTDRTGAVLMVRLPIPTTAKKLDTAA